MATDAETPPPIEIPASQLDEETLFSLIQEFVLREGTDYGAQEILLETKVNQVRRQLERKDVGIYFDPATETVNLIRKDGSYLR